MKKYQTGLHGDRTLVAVVLAIALIVPPAIAQQRKAQPPQFPSGSKIGSLNLFSSETAKVMVDVSNISADVTSASMKVQQQAKVETMFIMAIPEYMFLSSSAVKEIARHGGSVRGLVPDPVAP